MADPEGVSIAFGADTLDESPTWERLDTTDNLVASWSIDRGRSYELDKTSTGTATIAFNDTLGLFDPTNSGSPYFGNVQPLKQAALALQNPVTSTWTTLFRGFVEDYDYVVDPSQTVMRLEVQLVDALDILAAAQMTLKTVTGTRVWGDALLAANPGVIYFDPDTAGPDDRINQILDQANWPSGLRSIFSGNVKLKETSYSPNTDALSAIQDAADAEFPGVANVYVSKSGLVTFHGRLARFDPTEPTYGINTWKCGDGAAVTVSPTDTAQMRGYRFGRDKGKIINSASATPQGIADADIEDQLVEDSGSIAFYGTRSWSAENLLTDGATVGGNTDLEETKKFATYYVDNFKEPQTRISQITLRSMPLGTPGATPTWALICGVEISDLIEVTVIHPGGGGFAAEPYFVEGIHYEVNPLNTSYHDVTLTLDVSPQLYFQSNPF